MTAAAAAAAVRGVADGTTHAPMLPGYRKMGFGIQTLFGSRPK